MYSNSSRCFTNFSQKQHLPRIDCFHKRSNSKYSPAIITHWYKESLKKAAKVELPFGTRWQIKLRATITSDGCQLAIKSILNVYPTTFSKLSTNSKAILRSLRSINYSVISVPIWIWLPKDQTPTINNFCSKLYHCNSTLRFPYSRLL